jgi:hypothetical protein
MRKTRSNEQLILGLKNNVSFLSQYNFQGGRLVVCASPLGKEYSDFPVHSIFVPIVHKMAVSTANKTKLAYTIGIDKQIEIADANPLPDAVYKIRNLNSEWIPGQRTLSNKVILHLDDHFRESGFFEVVNEKKQRSEWIALNFNRKESQLELYSKNELETIFQGENLRILDAMKTNLSAIVAELHSGIALWKLCIILALVFLASEVLLLRFLR